MKIDELETWTPETICQLRQPDKFWITILWLSKQKGWTLERSWQELEEVYYEYFGEYRWANVRCGRRAYINFCKKMKQSNKMILPEGMGRYTFAP